MQRTLWIGIILIAAALACGPAIALDEAELPAPAGEAPDQPAVEAVVEEPPVEGPSAETLAEEPAGADALAEQVGPVDAVAHNADWEIVTGELSGMAMVYVPGGCFTMGSSNEQVAANIQACQNLYAGAPFPCLEDIYRVEAPAHEVCVDAFWIGQFEVTNAQYAACVEAGICSPPLDSEFFGDPEYLDYPVLRVPYDQAVAFAGWLGGSLPTEAQWEYAARGPDSWLYPWGDAFDGTRLNYCDMNCDVYFWVDAEIDDGYAYAAPVGTYPTGASWTGAQDMSGNAWEWTGTVFKPYPYDAADGRDDAGSAGDRVLRGGAFDMSWLDLRTALRYQLPPDGSCRSYGFRMAAPADAVPGDQVN